MNFDVQNVDNVKRKDYTLSELLLNRSRMESIFTTHSLINTDAKNINDITEEKSVALVVTSPPYPMIEMWDEMFCGEDHFIREAFSAGDHERAFVLMHQILDRIWEETDRVVMDGGYVCINIGDATRNCNGHFRMFSNHTHIISKFSSMGYDILPDIHWRKPSSSPNKFMGSGMYPSGAYVTYEHEYILIFRKGGNRKFLPGEKIIRRNSAYFWEERNLWFSDVWEFKGCRQTISNSRSRSRSAAFPIELAYRLINMYSIKHDRIYDPFAGTGTTMRAAMASERNSIGCETDRELCLLAIKEALGCKDDLNEITEERIRRHLDFIKSLPHEKYEKLYDNINHGFKVKTRQEREMVICLLKSVDFRDGVIKCEYDSHTAIYDQR